MSSAGRVLVVGDIMTDVIVKPEGPLVRGTDRAATIRTLPGGSGANQAAWLAHFGVATVLAAKVGQADVAACEASLRALGIEPRLRGDASVGTGVLVTLVDTDGERSFLTDRGANATLDRDDLPDALLDGVTLLHVSGYALFAERPRRAVLALVHAATARGLATTIDPGSAAFLEAVGPAAFLGWTRGAAIAFPNEDEAAVLTGTRDEAEQRRVLAAHYGLVAIKRGGRGAEIVGTGGRCLGTLPAPAVAVLDTTGAGDAFLAAFLAGQIAGLSLDLCLRRGVAAGSLATTMLGGRPAGVARDVGC
jgi:sugar/nucleoside kinase (ribokinase family)